MKYLRLLQTSCIRILHQYHTRPEVFSQFLLPTKEVQWFLPHQRGFVSSCSRWCNLSLTRFYASRNTKQESEASDSKARTHFERRLVPFTREHLFEVVKNVDEYKYFVPWCEDSRVFYKKVHQSHCIGTALFYSSQESRNSFV
ncbi:Coenzyme Q-binding protein COQ10 homolog, mitochondrial [Galdieria sulphuraria]|nr:Coenzyme Q-binding protein COQ10 homolog, mitochondrial [Galdieria sulphuraria]